MKTPLRGLVFCLLLIAGGTAFADACTYREALFALEQGNTIRGMALMRMASRDGDRRAEHYLREGPLASLAILARTEARTDQPIRSAGLFVQK